MSRRHRFCLARLGLLVVTWAMLTGAARAQQRPPAPTEPPLSLRRCRWLPLAPGRDTTEFVVQDSLTVVPATVEITSGGPPRPATHDPRTDRYRWVQPARRDAQGQPLPDSVRLCYRVLPLRLAAPRFRRSRSLMDSLGFRAPMHGLEDFSQKEQILSTPGINKTGNLARGISFGNTQNVFVNSALNLQLEGKLADNINLTAAISDQNVPFQPEGNTQQLQQFDKIYLTLTNPNWNLTAGDVVLRNKPDYFLRYYKNIQGAAGELNLGPPLAGLGPGSSFGQGVSNAALLPGGLVQSPVPGLVPAGTGGGGAAPPATGPSPATLNPTAIAQPQLGDPNQAAAAAPPATAGGLLKVWQSSTTAAGGVAKGKFASIDVPPIDNVQGPYRLNGPNGEQFLIVLANSERVYLDGRLQARGFDADYTIDYNLAEITFTPRHLITRNTRIKVDFEYSDLNYARSLYALSHYQQAGRLRLRANFYQEADNPNNAPNLNLTDTLRATLRAAGNVAFAQADGAVPATYTRTQVLYRRDAAGRYARAVGADTLGQVYAVRFTDVGPGQGDYRLSTTNLSSNGRVYEFAGLRQGRFAPVRRLPTPLLKQMLAGGASFRVDSSTTVFVDAARSQLARNRFAPEVDAGGAVRLGYAVLDRRLPAWAAAVLPGYRLRSTLDYEYTAARFAPIDRYRDIEFDRNWSAASTGQNNAAGGTQREDNILNASLWLVRNATNSFGYRFSRRFRPGEVSGVQHWLEAAHQVGRVEVRGSLFVLNSAAGRFRSTWARGEATARLGGGRLVPGYAYRFDKNRVALPGGDSLRSVNYFDEHNVFVQSRDSAKTQFRVDYAYRQDQLPTPDRRAFFRRSVAQTWQGSLAARPGKLQDVRLTATYRDLAVRDSSRLQTALGQAIYNLGLLQNQVRSELSYSVATGRELKRDYSFLAVPAGTGTHYYAGDLNGNGQQDKEEFLEAQTPDAQYRTFIKVYLPTTDYVTAFTNRLSYRLSTAAPRGWREAGGLRAAAARLATLTSIAVDRRTTNDNLLARLSPFRYNKEDPQLLAFNQLLRNTLYFNRSNPIFGAEFTIQQTQQKTLLAQGTDLRNLSTQSLLLRRTLAQSFTGRLTGSRDVREAQSTYLVARNYRLLSYNIQPEISYQPTPAFRLTANYLRTVKRNVLDGPSLGTRGVFDELGLETRLSQVSKRTVTAALRYTGVGFDGDPASVVGLEILNALRPGANYTWNLNLEQRLSNGLNITVAYDGRKANGLNTVHTGRMQVAVLF